MSKVIHLSGEAHALAKKYCERHGLKMSHWVAELVTQASREVEGSVQPAFTRRRVLPAEGEAAGAAAEGKPAFAAPPFWADGPAS